MCRRPRDNLHLVVSARPLASGLQLCLPTRSLSLITRSLHPGVFNVCVSLQKCNRRSSKASQVEGPTCGAHCGYPSCDAEGSPPTPTAGLRSQKGRKFKIIYSPQHPREGIPGQRVNTGQLLSIRSTWSFA
jgi:hypothetical protein